MSTEQFVSKFSINCIFSKQIVNKRVSKMTAKTELAPQFNRVHSSRMRVTAITAVAVVEIVVEKMVGSAFRRYLEIRAATDFRATETAIEIETEMIEIATGTVIETAIASGNGSVTESGAAMIVATCDPMDVLAVVEVKVIPLHKILFESHHSSI